MQPAARVGTLFNHWRLSALLGSSPIAATYEAHHFADRATIKILHAHLAESKPVRERFLAIGALAQRVAHPGVLRVTEAATTRSDEVFLVQDLLKGETLEAAWKGETFTMEPARALPIVVRVLDCLAACHAEGAVHRGLRPGCVFLLEGDEVRLLDLGMAEVRSAGVTRTSFPNLSYLAPEEARGGATAVDAAVDVFSVGAILHALLTGHRVNHGPTEVESLVLAATRPVPPVERLDPALPKALAAIVDRALQWDPRKRYASALKMREALARVPTDR